MVASKLCPIVSKITPLLLSDFQRRLHIVPVLKEISEFTAQPAEICGLHWWVLSVQEKLAPLKHGVRAPLWARWSPGASAAALNNLSAASVPTHWPSTSLHTVV